MKTRSGFVSNSSSSSFILYGTIVDSSEFMDMVFADANHFELMTMCGITDIDEFKEEFEIAIDNYDTAGPLSKLQPLFNNLIADDYFADDRIRIGLVEDPEYLKEAQVKNGLWSKEQFDDVDEVMKRFNLKASVDGGTWDY